MKHITFLIIILHNTGSQGGHQNLAFINWNILTSLLITQDNFSCTAIALNIEIYASICDFIVRYWLVNLSLANKYTETCAINTLLLITLLLMLTKCCLKVYLLLYKSLIKMLSVINLNTQSTTKILTDILSQGMKLLGGNSISNLI